MKTKIINMLVINIILITLVIYLWYFKTGHVKSPEGSLVWQVLVMIFGIIFGWWSISTNLPLWKQNRVPIHLLNIVLPVTFISFHLYWIIFVVIKVVTN